MFRGCSSEGFNREVSSTVECASLCRTNGVQPLATVEAAIFSIASELATTKLANSVHLIDFSSFNINPDAIPKHQSSLTDGELCRGILPTLCHIIGREKSDYSLFKAHHGQQLTEPVVADKDIHPSKKKGRIITDDFECKICQSELSNLYFHCEGCDKLLNMDFNICGKCHSAGEHKRTISMRKDDKSKVVKLSTVNHTGIMSYTNRNGIRCPCKKGHCCDYCKLCTCCACICHSTFSPHFLRKTPSDLDKMLETIEAKVTSPLQYAKMTETRLKLAVDRDNGDAISEKLLRLNEYLGREGGGDKDNDNDSSPTPGAPRKDDAIDTAIPSKNGNTEDRRGDDDNDSDSSPTPGPSIKDESVTAVPCKIGKTGDHRTPSGQKPAAAPVATIINCNTDEEERMVAVECVSPKSEQDNAGDMGPLPTPGKG